MRLAILIPVGNEPTLVERSLTQVLNAPVPENLDLGAGIGNIAGHLTGRRLHYLAAEQDPLYLHALRNRFLRTPSVVVLQLDPERTNDYERAGGSFDTVFEEHGSAIKGIYQLNKIGTLGWSTVSRRSGHPAGRVIRT